jgi:hypothetical protein
MHYPSSALFFLTSKYWQRPVITLIPRLFPCYPGQRLYTAQEMNRRFTPDTSATEPATTDCPCCVEYPDEIVGVTTSHPATPLQMEAYTVIRPAPAAQPRTEHSSVPLRAYKNLSSECWTLTLRRRSCSQNRCQ